MWKKLQRIIAYNILLPSYYKTQAYTYTLCSPRFLRAQSLQHGSAPEGARTGARGGCAWARLAFQSCTAKEDRHPSGAGNLYFRYQPTHTPFFFVGVGEMWSTASESV